MPRPLATGPPGPAPPGPARTRRCAASSCRCDLAGGRAGGRARTFALACLAQAMQLSGLPVSSSQCCRKPAKFKVRARLHRGERSSWGQRTGTRTHLVPTWYPLTAHILGLMGERLALRFLAQPGAWGPQEISKTGRGTSDNLPVPHP